MAKIDSGPLALDWSVYAGDANRELFSISANDPVDITGATIEAQARTTAPDPTVAATGIVTLTNTPAGQFHVEWDGVELRELLAGQDKWVGRWDLQITGAGQTLPETLVAGVFTVVHDVTRSTP